MRGAARDLRSGSGLTANRKNLPNASELYPAFDVSSCSPRPALCDRPLLALPAHFHEEGDCARVPDAAPTGKTLEAVKERVCFYSFCFQSQQKVCVCNPRIFRRVQRVHRPVTGIGATGRVKFAQKARQEPVSSISASATNANDFATRLRGIVKNAGNRRPARSSRRPVAHAPCQIEAKTRSSFARLDSRGGCPHMCGGVGVDRFRLCRSFRRRTACQPRRNRSVQTSW